MTDNDLNEQVNVTVDDASVITVPIDATLQNSNEAADAKAVGDALALKADKSELQAAVKVNNQPADAQGLILIDGRHIPVSDQDTETLANAVTDLKGKTAADIPMSSDSGAKTIAEVVNANSEAIEGMEEMTGATMPIESGSQTTVKAAIEARVKTVNRKAPDADGDVDLSVVPLAENLQSDKMESVEGSFIIRTTGGNASVSDGKAYPLHLFGSADHAGYVAEQLNMTVIPIARTEPDEPITATIDRDTFVAYVDESSTINLYYTTEWSADPELYGITVTGTPEAGDQITVVYVKEVRGTITVANPARLVGTGWNLFDYNNGYARVVKYSTEYGYKIGGSYASLQFSATLTGERSSITPGVDGLFNVPSDGYVFVTGGNNTDTYILTTWSDWMEGPSSGYWEPYRESGIDLSAVMTTYFHNGLLAVGTTRDEIDLSAKRSISRIERMAYSEENRAAAAASGRSYDFDQNYIYIVRESAVISAITIDTTYNVSEHGLEWFTETTLPVISEILYGKNLRDKLERDVVTISAQTLTEEEKAQVRTNIGAMSQADGDKKLVAPTTAGTAGQLLHLKADGGTEWTTQGTPTDAQVGTAVSAWLTAHPEATTTVEDGAISRAKLNDDLKAKTDAVPDLKSAIVQTSSVSEDAKAANIFEGKQSNVVGSYMTRSADGYSGEHCVGTLRYQVYEYISSTFALSSSNQYTLYIVPKHHKASYGKICFVMRDQTSAANVKVGGQDLIWEIGTGNNVLQFTPDANYSTVYFNIYNNDENYQSGMSIDETFYIYLLNGAFGDKDVFTNEKIYKTMSEQFGDVTKNKDLFRMSKISPTVIENNLIKDSLISLSYGGLTITPDKSTSSVEIVGTLAYQINRYINNANIAIETGKEYTLFIAARMEKAYNKGIKFILYDQTSGTPVTADGKDVCYSLDNNLPVVFTPDGDHAKVFINIYQETEVGGIVLDNDYYIYLVEGYYTADKFTTTESDISKVIYDSILSKNILSGNLFDGKQYNNYNTTNIRRTVDGYSSVHITGTLQFHIYEFISKLITLESGKAYTLFIKPKKWENKYNKIFFNLKDQTTNDFVKTGGQSLFYQMNRRKAFTFVPDADYSSVFVNIYQDDPLYSSGMEIDETFYIYLVEGDYATSDLTIPDTDEELYAYDYERTQVTNALIVGLPVLELTGETNLMTKDDEVTLQWVYNGSHGNCTMKWQGSSSVAYSKKNYTIKFNSKIDMGWGEQKKYCLKANYIDDTSSLNLCCAKLWSEIVANRDTHPAIPVAANKGAMDGFPIIIMLNGKFHGLYTMNTPKDKWTFGMGSGETEYIVTAEQGTPATSFKALTDLEGDDFELEYAPDGVSVDTVKTSLNTMITSVMNASLRGWESAVDPYLDVNTAIDYMIFSALITNLDGVNKNYILTTYDGTKWWFNAYDLDSTFGLYWTGGSYVSAGHTPTSFAGMDITSGIFHLIYSYSKPALIARYRQLRSYLLSEEHIYSTFYNFCVKIPEPIHAEDQKKWPLKPGTNTNTLARIMENFRLRCAFIDAEIDAMET